MNTINLNSTELELTVIISSVPEYSEVIYDLRGTPVKIHNYPVESELERCDFWWYFKVFISCGFIKDGKSTNESISENE